MSQPNFHASSYALINLLIGLGRGYHKELKRLGNVAEAQSRRTGTGSAGYIDLMDSEISKLEEDFVEYLTEHLRGYYDPEDAEFVAGTIIGMIRDFEEQRD